MKHHAALHVLMISASCIAISNRAFAQDVSQDGSELPQSETADSDGPPQSGGEIVVTGIRKSLEAATDQKRADSRIVDLIVSEDIGKLPDNNVAESLQRVTGVSINRDFGVGSEVSIRGLPQNRVEINGRSTLGSGRNGINFQDVPSEILSAVEVVKSPTPKMIEGALGGTINLKTLRPLQLRKPVFSVSAKAEYNELSEKAGPILSATAGDKWDVGSGTFGILGSISYQKRTLRQDEYRNSLNVAAFDGDGDGISDTGNVVYPLNFSVFASQDRRERYAGNLALQWQPASGDGMMYLEGTYTDLDSNAISFSPNLIQNSPLSSDAERADGFEIDDTDQLVGFTDSDVRFINRTESARRHTKSLSAAAGGEWTFNKLKVSGELSYANSRSSQPYLDLRFYGVDPVAEAADPSALNPATGTVLYDTDNSSVPTVSILDGNILSDPSRFVFRRYENRKGQVDNDEFAGRLDFSVDEPFLPGFLSSIDFGARATYRQFKSMSDRLYITNIENGLQDADGNPIVIYQDQFPSGVNRQYDFDLFPGHSGAFDLGKFVAFDPNVLIDSARTIGIVSDLLAGTNLAIAGDDSDFEPQLNSFSDIGENTLAAYVQANIDTQIAGMPLRAVVGTRYVRTNLTTNAFQKVLGEYQGVQDQNSYDDWLPSANITLSLDNDLLLRFAAAKVMRRPDFGQLSPALVINSDNTRGSRGNPQLNPFRAKQLDVSIEKYWGDGNLLSVAGFYKDVSSFFNETEVCLDAPSFVAISNPNVRQELCYLDGSGDEPTLATPLDQLGIPTETQVNGESGSVKGFEVGYQHAFTFLPGFLSGLGMNANYTYADSKDPNGRPLEDISKHTVNVVGYYEKYGFGFRAAYTYRSRFLDNAFENRVRELGNLLLGPGSDDPTLGNSYREPRQQIDLSASYDINKNLHIQADVVNLTKEKTFDTGTSHSLWRVLQSDRRFTLGIAARF